ncbi:U1 small nuclear ribonucleoprotein C [Elsinoe fawcettii]|nr:U1 small nuclear ribonucleoprotein C [Elsinoe fawcettii]
MSVRKAHNSGRNHLRNVIDYYQQIGHERAQSVIDSITQANAEAGTNAPPPIQPSQFIPPGGFQFPPGMPPPGAFPPGPGGRGMPPFPPMNGMPPFPPGNMPPFAGSPPGGMQFPPPPGGLPFPPPGGMPFPPHGMNGLSPGPGGPGFNGGPPPQDPRRASEGR